MASLNKTYDRQKLLGQVYTPRFVVEKILNETGYDGPHILGKSILDPACGDGRFLEVAIERIIRYSPAEQLEKNLECVHGWDIDPQAVQGCLARLDALVRPLGVKPRWNIKVCDALREGRHRKAKPFDFIVGNPPYIRIQHLREEDRRFIQQHYAFCRSGSTDIYIAFFELCYHLLADGGVCGLITPNSFLSSETARIMRNYFLEYGLLRKLTNYGSIQLFDNATTYSAITIFGRKRQDHFIFEQAKTARSFEQRKVSCEELKGKPFWQLSVRAAVHGMNEGVRLGDICHIHVGITTLCDKAYIFQVEPIEGEPDYVIAHTYYRGRVKMEKAILKPIIKASKLKDPHEPVREFVLFPYEKINGKHQIIAEERLKRDYPLAYDYLLSVKEWLDKRDNGKPNPVAWYAFGRSQGLDTSFGKKILFSPMNKVPRFILVENEDTTFYSGYCIKYAGNYDFLLRELNSRRMADFIAVSSRDFRGGWKAYNKKVLQEFTLKLPEEERHLLEQKQRERPSPAQQPLPF